jgi:hypothetical protein
MQPSFSGTERAKQAQLSNFRVLNKNTLKAVFDVALPSGLMICGVMLHENAGKRWIALPGKPYLKNDGSQGWLKILDFADYAARERFNELILPLALKQLAEFERATAGVA